MLGKAAAGLFLSLSLTMTAAAVSWKDRQRVCTNQLIETLKSQNISGTFVKNIRRRNEGAARDVMSTSAVERYVVVARVPGSQEVLAKAECLVTTRGKRIVRFNMTQAPISDQWVASKP